MQKDIIQNQVNYLIELGFPELLKLSVPEYLNSFSIIGESMSPDYQNRFDFPVVVDPRISFVEFILKTDISNFLKPEEISDFSNNFSTPYVYFTHDSKKYSSETAATATAKFDADEEGCTLQELLFFNLFYPHLFEGIAMDAIKSTFRQTDYHPCLLKVKEKTDIGAHWHNDLTAGINILSKGKRLFQFHTVGILL